MKSHHAQHRPATPPANIQNGWKEVTPQKITSERDIRRRSWDYLPTRFRGKGVLVLEKVEKATGQVTFFGNENFLS